MSEQATEDDPEAAAATPGGEHDQSPEEEQHPVHCAIAAKAETPDSHESSAQSAGGGRAPRVQPLDLSRVQRHSCEEPPYAPMIQRLRSPRSPRVEIWLHEHQGGLAGASCEGRSMRGARGCRGRSTSEDSGGAWDVGAAGGGSKLVSTLSAEEKHDALQRLQAALR